MEKETKYIIIIASAFLILAIIVFFIGKKSGYALKIEKDSLIKVI